jgi:hypothetical protein
VRKSIPLQSEVALPILIWLRNICILFLHGMFLKHRFQFHGSDMRPGFHVCDYSHLRDDAAGSDNKNLRHPFHWSMRPLLMRPFFPPYLSFLSPSVLLSMFCKSVSMSICSWVGGGGPCNEKVNIKTIK